MNDPNVRTFSIILNIIKSPAVGLLSLAMIFLTISDFIQYLAEGDRLNIFENIPTEYLAAGIILGVVLYLGIDYWMSWQQVRRKKGEVKFSLNYIIAMIIAMGISAGVSWLTLTSGLGMLTSTMIEEVGFAILVALVVSVISAFFIDSTITRPLADGTASAAFIKAKKFFDENKAKYMTLIFEFIRNKGGNVENPAEVSAMCDFLKDKGMVPKDFVPEGKNGGA